MEILRRLAHELGCCVAVAAYNSVTIEETGEILQIKNKKIGVDQQDMIVIVQ